MIAGGEEFLEPDLTCGGRSRRNSHACIVDVEIGCLGVDHGSKAELVRGFAGASALRGGGFTVALGHGAAEQGEGGGVERKWRRRGV